MPKLKHSLILLSIVCILATVIGVIVIAGIDRQQLQEWLEAILKNDLSILSLAAR